MLLLPLLRWLLFWTGESYTRVLKTRARRVYLSQIHLGHKTVAYKRSE